MIGNDEHVWRWQPLQHTDPADAHNFVLCLRWRLGEPIGTLRVSCGTFTEMSEQLITLLHVLAVVLREAVDAIEAMSPGDSPPLFNPHQVPAAALTPNGPESPDGDPLTLTLTL